EIYNGVIERLEGEALATDKWDYLLSNGHRVLGFASDDSHEKSDIGQGWLMVRAAARTPHAILAALQRGNFYASTGVKIRSIRRAGASIVVETADADEIWAVGSWGVRLARVAGPRIAFDCSKLQGGNAYVRFVAYGRGSAAAWTQPFFPNVASATERQSPFVEEWWLSRIEKHRLSDTPPAGLDTSLDWRPVKGSHGFVDVHRLCGDADGVVYLANRFNVPRSGEWIIRLGHDGGVKMFVDGACVLHQPFRSNPATPDRLLTAVRLTRGTHEIVIALDTDHGLGQGIFLRFACSAAARRGTRRSAFPSRVGT
ncbi:MAG: hypothetical protein PHR35_20975, partial [Kiritimatiellae bacterium]|nr:hypothetical protein [Kiritimatiellia bacterium]